MKFVFTKNAERQWNKLPERAKQRIKDKLDLLRAEAKLLEKQLKIVSNLEPATHRLRIGSYRLLLMKNKSENLCLILKIGLRKEIYK